MSEMPESMDECFYFTNRTLGEKGNAIAWVRKPMCPECGKAKLGKPVDPKTGKVKSRAKEYVCPECNFTVQKEEFDSTLKVEIQYTCPHCGNEGEAEAEYKLKSFKGAKSYLFVCSKCNEKLAITKKMKKLKD